MGRGIAGRVAIHSLRNNPITAPSRGRYRRARRLTKEKRTDMNNPLDFSGKVALVTGAASGMRLATARASAEAGASVVLADFREDAVKAEAEKLTAGGSKAIAIRCDISD